jgi:hypothetical protein
MANVLDLAGKWTGERKKKDSGLEFPLLFLW